MTANARGYRRRRITRWPESLPSWLTWAAWDEVTAAARAAAPEATAVATIKGSRKKPEWRDMTTLERKAVAAYQTCYTPPYTFDRRLCKALISQLDAAGADGKGKGKITDKQAHWLWFYTQKHRRQISDKEVLREAERRAIDQ